MQSETHHISDEELLQAADGELAKPDIHRLQEHLAACWTCRARARELEETIAAFVGLRQQALNPLLPSAAGPRALLKARLAALPSHRQGIGFGSWRHRAIEIFGACLMALLLGTFAFMQWRSDEASSRVVSISVPDQRLTPGAATRVTRQQVCDEIVEKNRAVPASMQRRVFAAYGISGSDPRAYEVDYLITPALGGSEDIHNLWPHSYSAATIWNAGVKDKLEDRLHELVCAGQLDPAVAQREIASNWIEAYKKYLRTDQPPASQH